MEGEGSLRENKVKFPWLYSQPRYSVGDYSSSSTTAGLLGAFSWPPRSYSCSFCRREFRSAQALGGHMNVHRRDRARLRQSPPRDGQASNLNSSPYPNPNLNLYPNQNPTLSSSSPQRTEVPVAVTRRFPSWLSPSFTCVTSSSPSSSSSGEARISGPVDYTDDPPTLKEDHLRRRKAMKALFITEEMKTSAAEDEDGDDAQGLLRKKESLKLDLEIGLCTNPPDNLDLELRLGCT